MTDDGPDSMHGVYFRGEGVVESLAVCLAVAAEPPCAHAVHIKWTHSEYWAVFDLIGEMNR